ncbi:hypothetical protein CcaverHIS002_0305790 [Cutaneotrichosporon cavernicola]|nr:hypothetical protein CcaverHIS002_0305790 [Cutaneotrichosporon cavernicola]
MIWTWDAVGDSETALQLVQHNAITVGSLNQRQRIVADSHALFPITMISDGTLTDLSNGLGVAAMFLILAYHFVSVNGQRIKERQ